VEEWGTIRKGNIAIADPCEEPTDIDLERCFFVRLSTQRVENSLAVMYPACGQSIRTAWIERLYQEGNLSVPAPDHHADLGESIGTLHRIEEGRDHGVDPSRRAVRQG